jgi:hypothetical protein
MNIKSPFSAAIVMTSFCIALCSCGSKKESPIPEKWGKDFSISIYTGGGMLNESEGATFSHDSCIYIKKEGSTSEKKAFGLSEANRKEILKQLHELRTDMIRTDTVKDIIMDKETTYICFDGVKQFCYSDGASVTIHPEDREIFGRTYQFLMDIAKSDN